SDPDARLLSAIFDLTCGSHATAPDRTAGRWWVTSACSLENRRIWPPAAVEGDPARFGEGFERPAAAMLAAARSLEATEGDMRLVIHRGAVDVAVPGIELVDDSQPTGLVARHHAGGQAIL